MKTEVDQSGKIEQTNLDTIIALSNDIKISVSLKRRDKRKLQEYFKKQGKIKIFIFVVFSAMLAFLLQEYSMNKKVRIDMEYFGYEGFINQLLDNFLEKIDIKVRPEIEFGHVGKNSPAHKLAGMVAQKKKKPTKIIKLKDILELIVNK